MSHTEKTTGSKIGRVENSINPSSDLSKRRRHEHEHLEREREELHTQELPRDLEREGVRVTKDNNLEVRKQTDRSEKTNKKNNERVKKNLGVDNETFEKK